jgi:hypothetical protein
MMSPYDSFMTHYLFSLLSDAHSACLLYFSLTHYCTIFSTSLMYSGENNSRRITKTDLETVGTQRLSSYTTQLPSHLPSKLSLPLGNFSKPSRKMPLSAVFTLSSLSQDFCLERQAPQTSLQTWYRSQVLRLRRVGPTVVITTYTAKET